MEKKQPNDNGKKPDKQDKPAKKPLTWAWRLVYAVIGAMFVAGAVMVIRQVWLPPQTDFELPTPQPATASEATPTAAPATPAGTGGAPEETLAPSTPEPVALKVASKIYFVEQKRSCPVIVVGIEEDNSMGAPQSADEAGWFNRSVPPGDNGTSYISGHQAFGGKKGVFSVLRQMKEGEEVIVEFEDGTLRYFTVDRIEIYDKTEVPEEYLTAGTNTKTQLILYTCKGDYDGSGQSLSRVVAICSEQLDKRQADDPFLPKEAPQHTEEVFTEE